MPKLYEVGKDSFYKTRRGYLVKPLSTTVKSKFPILGLIQYPGEEIAGQWDMMGKFMSGKRYKYKPHALDLV